MNTTIHIDKISAVTKNLALTHDEEIVDTISTTMGTVLAAEVLEDKTVYSELEQPSGRMSKLKKGDIIAVALGERMALKGFAGRLPKSLKTGDVIHLLNFGGVAGICTSANMHEVGKPLRIKVLGGIARGGNLLNIGQASLYAPANIIERKTPLIIITGTSMDSGKTTVAVEITKTLTRMGMRLCGAKVTGVAALRDLYKMEDYGVIKSTSFVDCGITSTANVDPKTLTSVTKGAINYLNDQHEPDAIMIEFGDGLMGRYGVKSVLDDKEIQENVRLHVGCASDPAGALMLGQKCADMNIPLDVISGPVTDNEVGQAIIREHMNLITYNAFTPSSEWLDLMLARWAKDYKVA